MPETRVQVRVWEDDDRERTQYSTTIPKELAEAMDIQKGDRLEWSVASGNAFRVENKGQDE